MLYLGIHISKDYLLFIWNLNITRCFVLYFCFIPSTWRSIFFWDKFYECTLKIVECYTSKALLLVPTPGLTGDKHPSETLVSTDVPSPSSFPWPYGAQTSSKHKIVLNKVHWDSGSGEGDDINICSSELDSGEFSWRDMGPALRWPTLLWLKRQCPRKCGSMR